MSILIDESTTFIIQGITGREAVNMTRECLNYGSKIVGGVTPGRGGRDVYGVPVSDTVREITARTRVDIVARGVIKGVVESGYDPAEKIAIFRIPGSWEEEGFKILARYGVEYCDRTVSMSEAARRAVEKVGARI